MGGKNHQPCSSYLENSTKMSRSLSSARAELEGANIALEDLLLAELSGQRGSVRPITAKLDSSEGVLNEALSHCHALRRQMADNDFVDLPTLKKTNLHEVGDDFTGKGMVDSGAWARACAIMSATGFVGMLTHFEAEIAKLRELTALLNEQTLALHGAANAGQTCSVLEENRSGNIKIAFAQLYATWNTFDQVFLASSMLSTELWYRHTGKKSLCENAAMLLEASAA